jgi:hypothetical protein
MKEISTAKIRFGGSAWPLAAVCEYIVNRFAPRNFFSAKIHSVALERLNGLSIDFSFRDAGPDFRRNRADCGGRRACAALPFLRFPEHGSAAPSGTLLNEISNSAPHFGHSLEPSGRVSPQFGHRNRFLPSIRAAALPPNVHGAHLARRLGLRGLSACRPIHVRSSIIGEARGRRCRATSLQPAVGWRHGSESPSCSRPPVRPSTLRSRLHRSLQSRWYRPTSPSTTMRAAEHAA